MPAVNPKILIWARETAALSPEEAAQAIGLNDARGKTGAERLAALESGEEAPSRSILLNMVKKYRRPLLVFYLNSPPRQGDRGQDFRTVPGAAPPSYNPILDALIRSIKSRQNTVRSVLEDEEATSLDFIGSATMEHGTKALVDRITDALSFQLSEFRKQRTKNNAFSYLRARIEGAGIFVMLTSNLGSHHSNISTDIFRGFAIADPIAPFIIINDQDARSAWSFTALHEVTHLWLGTTGISGASSDTQLERFCNDVASEILLPANELQEIAFIRSSTFDEALEQISAFAETRKISRSMVAYKLFQSDIISEERWQGLINRFQRDWIEKRKINKEEQAQEGGPTYYIVRRHRLGQALLGLVSRALVEGTITHTKAGQILGVKPRNVEPLLNSIPFQGGI